MKVKLVRADIAKRPSGAVALGILQGVRGLSGAAAAVDRATRGSITAVLERGDFTGAPLESVVIYPRPPKAPRVILVGLGRAADLTARRVREVAAVAARRARDLGVGTLTTIAHGTGRGGLDPRGAARATAEGSVLGHYRYTTYRTRPGPRLRKIEVLAADPSSARVLTPAVEQGAVWGEAACLARDLANTPGEDLTPERLADRAREVAEATGARATVLDVPRMERVGMGALLAVGRGSAHPPRFIVLESKPERRGRKGADARPVVLIGKGVTFDTGGISIKPRENMQRMKADMAGAAAVIGAFSALPGLRLPFPVFGLIPSAENMPGGKALKPGDVVRALDGTTIEVINTDAEGRLLLADALGYARRYRPAMVIDLATLTGGITLAMGHHAAGLFTDDAELERELREAGEACGERLWPFPLWDDYGRGLRGGPADLANGVWAKEGAAIVAAVFLKHFARGMRWAHLDIAGTAWSFEDLPHRVPGATGYGVRLLLEWLSRRSSAATRDS